jgi:hypothetical protein
VAGSCRRNRAIAKARELARTLLVARGMRTRILSSLFVIALGACVADEGTPGLEGPDDIDDSELAGLADDGKADSLHTTATYFEVSRDMRKCAWPACGGWWVSRVNREWTKCHDGRWRNACYAVDVDHDALGLSEDEVGALTGSMEEGRVLLRGRVVAKSYAGRRMGQFRATEAWRAATAAEPSGTFYRVSDKQLVCIYSPCPSLHEAKLNSTIAQDIHSLDLARVGDETLINEAWLALESGPVIVAGSHSTFIAPLSGKPGTSLDASQLYTRVRHDAGALSAYAPQPGELVGRGFSDPSTATYPRTYRFESGTLLVEDAVAPCAPGAVCIWSGIVTRSASWSLSGDRVSLAYTGPATEGWNLRYFDTLLVRKDAAGELVLVEQQPDGLLSGRQFRAGTTPAE